MQSILLTDESRIISENSCYQEIKSIREKNGGHSDTYNRFMKNMLDDDERILKRYGSKNFLSNISEKVNEPTNISILEKKCIIKVDKGQNTIETGFSHSKENNHSEVYHNPKQVQVSQINYSAVLNEPLIRATHFSSLPKHIITPLTENLVQKTEYACPQIIIPPKEVIIQQKHYHVPIQGVSNIILKEKFAHVPHVPHHNRNKSEIAIRKSNWFTISAEGNNEKVFKIENRHEPLLFRHTTDGSIQKDSSVISRPKEDWKYIKIEKEIEENMRNEERNRFNVQNYVQFLSEKEQSIGSGLNKVNEEWKKPSNCFSHSRNMSDTFTKTKFDLEDPINSEILKKIKFEMGYGETTRNENQSESFFDQKNTNFHGMYKLLVPKSNLFKKSLERIPENSEPSSMKEMSSQAEVRESEGSACEEDNRFKKSIKESIFAQESAEKMNKKSSRIRSEANLDESIANGLETLLELNLDNFPVSEGEQSESNLSCFSILR